MNIIFMRIMTPTQETRKVAVDNRSIPFLEEGKEQHQNNNTMTWDLMLQILSCLMTQRQGKELAL